MNVNKNESGNSSGFPFGSTFADAVSKTAAGDSSAFVVVVDCPTANGSHRREGETNRSIDVVILLERPNKQARRTVGSMLINMVMM
jgi:hypothetical protein